MSLETDIARIALQEKRLQFDSFGPATAWDIGSRLRAAADRRGVAVAIDISLFGFPLFYCAMPGTTPNNADWIRRKKNTVAMLHTSSYGVGRSLELEKTSLEAKMGLALRDHASHGGCFPITLRNTGCVGTITVSGLPQRQDHELVVEILAEYLNVPLAEVAFEPAGA